MYYLALTSLLTKRFEYAELCLSLLKKFDDIHVKGTVVSLHFKAKMANVAAIQRALSRLYSPQVERSPNKHPSIPDSIDVGF